MNSATKLLDDAIALIKKGWTQNTYCKNSFGMTVNVDNKEGTCWCLVGALMAADKSVGNDDYLEARRAVERVVFKVAGHTNAIAWNDEPKRTRTQVLKVLREAKELVE